MRDPQWGEGGEQKRSHDIMQLSYIRLRVRLLPLGRMPPLISQSRERDGSKRLPRMGHTVPNLSQLQRKKRGSLDLLSFHHELETLCSCIPGAENMPDPIPPKSIEKIPIPTLPLNCISLKCRIEAQLQVGPTAGLPEQHDRHAMTLPWEVPLLTTIWDLGAACPQTLCRWRAWKHVTRKPP